MMLYFVHQLIELRIMRTLLGWRFNDWTAYGVALGTFLVGLLLLARAWQAARAAMRGRGSPAVGLPRAS